MDILMPQLGETVTEGTIISWQKSLGDEVAPGDVLFEIETDKTTMEVPATSAGTITEILVQVGQVVPIGAVVAVILALGAVAASSPAAKSAGKQALAPVAPPTPSAAAPAVSPPVA